MGTLPTVLLVHPDARYRAGVHRLLVTSGFRVTGEAGGAASGKVMIARRVADVLVVSHCAGDVHGLVRTARRRFGLDVVVLAMSPDPGGFVDMMMAGAAGLACACNIDRLPSVIDEVHSGAISVPAALAGQLLEECRRRLAVQDFGSPWMRLTSRQREVIELLRRGHRTQQIAERLYVEPVTVRCHIAAALHKLGVTSVAEAMKLLDGEDL